MATNERDTVTEMVRDVKVAMLTTTDSDGKLVSRPLATQDVEFSGDIWFIVERSSTAAAEVAARPTVNVAYAGRTSWVSVSGTASVVDDNAKLRELWDTFTDAWMEGGPENPNNVLLHVQAESAQYWDAPGSKVTQLVNLVKAKVTGDRFEGDSGTVQM